jgi:hypothetical protein
MVQVDPLSVLWLFFVLASLQSVVQRQMMLLQRRRALAVLLRERKATLIMLIGKFDDRTVSPKAHGGAVHAGARGALWSEPRLCVRRERLATERAIPSIAAGWSPVGE